MSVTAVAAHSAPFETNPWPATSDAFKHMIDRHEPVVFRGLARDWLPDGLTTDSAVLDWLTGIFGDRELPLSVGLPGDAGFVGTAHVDKGRSKRTTLAGERQFRTIATEMKRELAHKTGHMLYVQSVEVRKACPELLPYLKLPLEHCPSHGGHWRTWIGTGDHRVNLHYDGEENFFCTLAGHKRFSIAPFDALPDLYVGPLNGPFGPPVSIVDPLRPDFERFPRFAKVQRQVTTIDLGPGDVLYLPTNWWHYVESFGFNVAANYWWGDVASPAKAGADAAFMKALLELRGLPRHWREFWQQMFDCFVFQLDADPYAHLPTEHQGWAGKATPGRTEQIQRLLTALEQEAGALLGTTSASTRSFKVSPNVRLRVDSPTAVVLRDVERGVESTGGLELMAVFAQFARPQTPQHVIEAMRQAGLAEASTLSQRVNDLIAKRMIVAAE